MIDDSASSADNGLCSGLGSFGMGLSVLIFFSCTLAPARSNVNG
jgi:hypothetical protein